MPDDAAASPAPPPEAVDRAATCPFLLRVFWSERRHNDLQAYGDTPGSGVTPPNELRLYAWEDCTLRELADMVKHERAETRRPRCQLSFAIVYPDRLGRNAMKEVGYVWATKAPQQAHAVENKTLRDLHFQTGDFIDVAVIFQGLPENNTYFTRSWAIGTLPLPDRFGV